MACFGILFSIVLKTKLLWTNMPKFLFQFYDSSVLLHIFLTQLGKWNKFTHPAVIFHMLSKFFRQGLHKPADSILGGTVGHQIPQTHQPCHGRQGHDVTVVTLHHTRQERLACLKTKKSFHFYMDLGCVLILLRHVNIYKFIISKRDFMRILKII